MTKQEAYIFTETGFYPEISPELRGDDQPVSTDPFRTLYRMGLSGRPEKLTVSAAFLYQVSEAFFRELTSLPELELARERVRVPLTEATQQALLQAVPWTPGAEHISADWLRRVFDRLEEIFHAEIADFDGTVEIYLTEQNQNLHVPERIFFHLVENRNDASPFAFMATYASRAEDGSVRHVPLRYALTEYGGDRNRLLELLSCLQRAAEVSDLIAEFMESGEMFHPLRLTADEAFAFLKDVEAIEQTGILCRIPDWWRKKSCVPSLTVSLGGEKPSLLGFETLISLQPALTVDGEALTREEIEQLLAQTEGLALLKGKWVQVDHAKLRALLAQMETLPSALSLKDALQVEMGSLEISPDTGPAITNGAWLAELLHHLRDPASIQPPAVPDGLHAQLRPYQQEGYTWLVYMQKLGFGACLADDMGLGKTVQVLAYLEHLREKKPDARVLLIVPASLLGNWEREIEKFSPEIRPEILHGKTAAALSDQLRSSDTFLTITTCGMAARMEALQERHWDCLILDEAQAIKNPGTKQTRAVKQLDAQMKIAMTGTPIENDLTNLWSLFDFLNHGLLGSAAEFRTFCRKLDRNPQGYAKLKNMVSPFMLRRLKTDRKIIPDLPEKLEMVDYAPLSKKQVVLYRRALADLESRILQSDGMERRGAVLTAITKLKQICNHPDQYLGQDGFAPADSGKLLLLRELCETIYEKRERVLVFTQFREITEPLAAFLRTVFHADGYVLHGGTPVKKRMQIVEAFQAEAYVPFIVLSLKAGGTGLNLTKANHVIHFDRWWNPAVENQATDRAFRIGQTENVMVHKLVTQGTIEEKIDQMIRSKQSLAETVIGDGSEKWITELSNEELFSLLRLED